MKNITFLTLCFFGFLSTSCQSKKAQINQQATSIKFATYNVALYRKTPEGLAEDLKSGTDKQIQSIAAVVQQVRPDVIALMEFDYDPSGKLLQDFQEKYLGKSQYGGEIIQYPYRKSIASNTGVLSQHDYNNDGKVALPDDGFGYGRYEGQYAFAILSKFPIKESEIRSFQKFLWSAMPDAKQPMKEDGTAYYSAEAWKAFRLSSKNHIDIPIQITPGENIHLILSHPTPPVFDGPEDRNGLRNFDEIRLLKDYISNADYLVDDQGRRGGLPAGESFVIMGDLNADPIDGDSYPGAINQLLEHKAVQPSIATGKMIPGSQGGKAYNKAKSDKADPAFDTSFFGKRIDYVLPSRDMEVKASGVFWPSTGMPLFDQVKDKNASDHLLVWAEVSKN